MPDLAGVIREWRSMLGDDYDAASRFLLPTHRIARSARSIAPGCMCIHEIRPFRGKYLEVCPDGCEAEAHSKDEVVVHRLDVGRLGREIADSLGIDTIPVEPVPNIADAWRIGEYLPSAGFRFSVYLTLTGEPDALQAVVDGLIAQREPLIVITPTRSTLTHVVADQLKRDGLLLLAINDLFAQVDDRLTLLDGYTAASIFADFRSTHVPRPTIDDGLVFFDTPAGAPWEDVTIRFIDRHSVYVAVHGISGTYHCTQMNMASRKNAKPTVQWLLLETFAEGHGRLDWRNRKADRKNQKRKENLAVDLRRFFRIDGDPFAIEGDGWRARFTVSLRE